MHLFYTDARPQVKRLQRKGNHGETTKNLAPAESASVLLCVTNPQQLLTSYCAHQKPRIRATRVTLRDCRSRKRKQRTEAVAHASGSDRYPPHFWPPTE